MGGIKGEKEERKRWRKEGKKSEREGRRKGEKVERIRLRDR